MAGPTLVSALALDSLTVRVTWSTEIKATDATATNDALNPANYTITATTAPAMPVTVSSVAAVYVGTALVEEQVDLTLDYELTPGATYSLDVANVVGVIGTTYTDPTPGTPVAAFTGYVPIAPPGRRFLLWDMLPEKTRDDDVTEDLHNFILCLQDVVDLLLADSDRFTDIFDYDACPADYLDAILYGLGNPFAFVLTDANKRRLCSVLVAIYKQKGTDQGIINALRFFLGATATITAAAQDTWEIPVDRIGGTDSSGQTCTVPDHTNDRLVLAVDCLFETDDPVEFTTTGTLPAPLVAGTTYYVRDVSGGAFKLATAAGGAVLDITSAGSGVHTAFNRDPGTAMVGPGYDDDWWFGFEVWLDIALTAEQRQQALLIVDYMRPVPAFFKALYEAGVKTWP